MKKLSMATLVWMGLASTTWAHPGHGADGDPHSVAHYVFDPLHFFSLVAAFVLGGVMLAVALRFRKTPKAALVRKRS